MRAVKYLWALPTTCAGLPFALLNPRTCRVVNGVLEIHGGCAKWFLQHCTILDGGAAAMTLGHIVIAIDQNALDHTRTHERVHVRQCERWGPFFLPAYLLCSAYLLLRRRDAYLDNPFEIAARSQS